MQNENNLYVAIYYDDLHPEPAELNQLKRRGDEAFHGVWRATFGATKPESWTIGPEVVWFNTRGRYPSAPVRTFISDLAMLSHRTTTGCISAKPVVYLDRDSYHRSKARSEITS